MLKRYLLGLTLALTLFGTLGQYARAGEKLVFGVTLMSLRHPFFQEMKDEMEKTAKDIDVVLRLTDADFDAGKQVRQIDDFVQQKVAAIVLAPATPRPSRRPSGKPSRPASRW